MDSALYPVRRTGTLFLLLASISLAYASYASADQFYRPGRVYLCAAIFALCVPFILWESLSATNLIFDPRGIRYKHRTIRWHDVRAIRVHEHTTTTHRGVFTDVATRESRVADVEVVQTRTSVALAQLIVLPMETNTEEIIVEAASGDMRIRGPSLVLPPEGLLEIAQRMIALQRAVLGAKGVIHARLGLEQDRPPDPILPPRGFGRKGIA